MSDDEFLTAVRMGVQPCGHLANLRLAWLLCRRQPLADATASMATAITRRAGVAGNRLDRELTRRWTARVFVATRRSPQAATFDAFLAEHPELLHRRQQADVA